MTRAIESPNESGIFPVKFSYATPHGSKKQETSWDALRILGG